MVLQVSFQIWFETLPVSRSSGHPLQPRKPHRLHQCRSEELGDCGCCSSPSVDASVNATLGWNIEGALMFEMPSFCQAVQFFTPTLV